MPVTPPSHACKAVRRPNAPWSEPARRTGASRQERLDVAVTQLVRPFRPPAVAAIEQTVRYGTVGPSDSLTRSRHLGRVFGGWLAAGAPAEAAFQALAGGSAVIATGLKGVHPPSAARGAPGQCRRGGAWWDELSERARAGVRRDVRIPRLSPERPGSGWSDSRPPHGAPDRARRRRRTEPDPPRSPLADRRARLVPAGDQLRCCARGAPSTLAGPRGVAMPNGSRGIELVPSSSRRPVSPVERTTSTLAPHR